jgi:hypothetical protein
VAEPRMISDYLEDLAARLPADIVEELGDGLDETYRSYLAAGLDPHAAGHAAVAEFGDAAIIAAAFTTTAPARRAARRLLGLGPVVGGCWAAALISARAWHWALPPAVALTFAAGLLASIALLGVAAFCGGYRAARRAAGAALIVLVALDLALPGMLAPTGLLRGWLLTVAAGLSLSRAAFALRALRRMHAG